MFERTKQFKASVLGSFTTWRKTSVTTLLWSWSSSLCMNPLPSLAPIGAPALLFFVCFSPWLDYPHCVRLLNELEDLFVFLRLAFMLCSGSHWKVSTANPGKTNRFVGPWPSIRYFFTPNSSRKALSFSLYRNRHLNSLTANEPSRAPPLPACKCELHWVKALHEATKDV